MIATVRSRFVHLAALFFLIGQLVDPAFAVPMAASNCEFTLGFAALHNLIPDVVGDCIEDEHHNPANGDGLQQTTKGLLVWRKADNWTAFTDGYHTWINGPDGLQRRLNTQRFSWEPPPSTCSISSSALTFSPAVLDADGTATGNGVASNPCDQIVGMMVDVYTVSTAGGQVIADAPTVFLSNVPPNGYTAFSYRVLAASPATSAQIGFAWFGGSPQDWLCVDVGASKCLNVDPWLKSAIAELGTLDEGQALLRSAADFGVRIERSGTGASLLATYTPATRMIAIDTRLDNYSSRVRATVMAHELQHAADDAAGQIGPSSTSCYRAEEMAFRRQAQVWADFWHNRLPPNVDSVHKMLNDITLTVARDPAGFTQSLIATYQSECNPG